MLGKAYRVLKKEGFFVFFKVTIIRLKLLCKRAIISFIAIPLCCLIIIISRWVNIRLIKLASNRVGHYTFDTELLLSAMELSVENKKPYKTFFYTISGWPISNRQLHRMWKRVMVILPFPAIMNETDRYLTQWRKKKNDHDLLKQFFASGQVGDYWDILGKLNQGHLFFTAHEKEKGQRLLATLGIPKHAPYICLLARDSLYLDKIMPKKNWSYHDFRDVDIDHYKKAALFLAEKGYYVIRMGKYVKKPFNVPHPNVIDYAHSKLRSDFLDIYLSAHCFFFISTSTGIDGVAKIFRRPVLATNFPLCDFDIFHHRRTLFIPKKIIDKNNDKLLTFAEIYHIFSEANTTKQVMMVTKEKNLYFSDNTPDEIVEAVQEMLDKLTNHWEYSAEDALLQQRFWQNLSADFNRELPVLTLPVFKQRGVKLEMASSFLRKNTYLLG